jgi:hypothetical protein
MGHDVTIMSDGSGFQNTARDIDLSRRLPWKFGGMLLNYKCKYPLHSRMAGYDIVALQNPNFLSLRPKRLRYFFDRLLGENERVFLTAAGTDSIYLRESLKTDNPLRYNEFRIGTEPAPLALRRPETYMGWLAPELLAYNEYVYDKVHGVVTVLYEYDIAARRVVGDDRCAYGGLPMDVDALTPVTYPAQINSVRLFLGRHRNRLEEKGTDLLEVAARRVMARRPGQCSLDIVENRPYNEYVRIQRSGHVVLDQIYSYTPAMNALLAMGQGLNVVTGGEPEYYDFIGETENHPIINALPDVDQLTEILDQVVCHPELIAARGEAGRRFVKKHHAAETVAQRYLNFWTK